VSVEDETGNVEVIHVTDAHPFYVEGLGWTGAAELEAGEHLVSSDGEILTVTANVDEPHPEGIPVFNFEVEGDHTYFVSDGIGDSVSDEDWVWVHNWCTPAQLLANRTSGLSAQSRVANQLRAAGFKVVGERLLVRTPMGKREVDIVVRINGVLHGIEVKSGGAVRTLGQIAKDAWINRFGATFFGRRAQGLRPQNVTHILESMMTILVP
jgi:hypothetical protein